MKITPRRVLPALAGAAVAASAAYSVGSQTNEGSAIAASSKAGANQLERPGRGPAGARCDLSSQAKKLGVSEAKLRSALDSLRPSSDGERRGDGPFPGLAKELGVSEAKLRSALESIRGEGHPRPGKRPNLAAKLAKALGKDVSDVRSALKKSRSADLAEDRAQRDAFVKQLAGKLGISEAKVRSALPAHEPGPDGGPGPGPGGGPGHGPGGGPGDDDGPGGDPGDDDGPGGDSDGNTM